MSLQAKLFALSAGSLLAEPADVPRAGAFLDDLSRRAPATVRLGLRAVLLVVLFAPLLLLRVPRTFLSASDEERVRVWNAALEHRSYAVRQLALVLKTMVCLERFDPAWERAS